MVLYVHHAGYGHKYAVLWVYTSRLERSERRAALVQSALLLSVQGSVSEEEDSRIIEVIVKICQAPMKLVLSYERQDFRDLRRR